MEEIEEFIVGVLESLRHDGNKEALVKKGEEPCPMAGSSNQITK